jgi:hypothetical protein
VPDSNQIHAYSANGGSLYCGTFLHGYCHSFASFYLVLNSVPEPEVSVGLAD